MNQISSELSREILECTICMQHIKEKESIYQCSRCYLITHLECIQAWRKTSIENSLQSVPNQSRNNNRHGEWRCPGCQLSIKASKKMEYRCFCGKVVNPELQKFLVPHTCGQMCGRTFRCPHKCTNLCHPGKCSTCLVQVTASCFCGLQNNIMISCGRAQYLKAIGESLSKYFISCGELCNKLLQCGLHKCKKICHEGNCFPCEEMISQKCYCGKTLRTTLCGMGKCEWTALDDKESSFEQRWFNCEKKCEKLFDCRIHHCEKSCHPQRNSFCDDKCILSPERHPYCYCGAYLQKDLYLKDKPRQKCTDPILACVNIRQIICACQKSSFPVSCLEMAKKKVEVPRCNIVCREKMNCGKHKCHNRCCTLSNTEHECDILCEKKLSCGLHKCQQLCHAGSCGPCPHVSWNDQSCTCGLTIRIPPIPCNVSPIQCLHPCILPSNCQHTLPQHSCHPIDVPCPPCESIIFYILLTSILTLLIF